MYDVPFLMQNILISSSPFDCIHWSGASIFKWKALFHSFLLSSTQVSFVNNQNQKKQCMQQMLFLLTSFQHCKQTCLRSLFHTPIYFRSCAIQITSSFCKWKMFTCTVNMCAYTFQTRTTWPLTQYIELEMYQKYPKFCRLKVIPVQC